MAHLLSVAQKNKKSPELPRRKSQHLVVRDCERVDDGNKSEFLGMITSDCLLKRIDGIIP